MAEKKHTPKEELTKMLTERIAKAEAAVEAAKEKLEEYKNAHVTAKKLLYEKLEELKALASEEEVKIKTQVKEKMEDSVVRIGEEIEVAQKSLKEKQALLKERDFMIYELEGRYHKKCVKNKGRYNIKEGYLLELEKLNDEFQKVAKENETLKTDKESKESRVLELQSQIREMNDLLRSLSIAKEGLNKYVENSKKIEERTMKKAVVRNKPQADPTFAMEPQESIEQMKAASMGFVEADAPAADDDDFWYSNPQDSIWLF